MEFIEKYFKEKTKDITFIEMKDSSQIRFNDSLIDNELPLPIMTDILIQNIKEGNLDNEVNISYIIDGMIYTIGVDNKFPYIEEYIFILKKYDDNINDYILYEALKDLENNDYDKSAIKLRTLLLLDERNVNGLLNYAIAIEEIAKQFIKKEDIKKGEKFLKYSTKQLENILNIDDKFAPSYYKLGYHYKYFQHFLKANLIWEKFLLLSKDDILSQEIREEMDIIKDDVNMETGLTYLNHHDYNRALGYFLELMPKHKDKWNINYLIGQTYMGLGEWDVAIDYMKNALKTNPQEADIYNELGIIYFNNNDILQAIEIFTNGINNCEEDYKLYFNRGLGYSHLNQYNKGLEDINKAFSLNPNDENIKAQKEVLENIVSNS